MENLRLVRLSLQSAHLHELESFLADILEADIEPLALGFRARLGEMSFDFSPGPVV
jgi:hypothetical protein